MNAVAVILASGSGQRFGENSTPKHLTPILRTPILIWTLDAVIRSKLFSSIIVVTRKDDIYQTDNIIKEYFPGNMFSIRLAEGSSARMQSFLFGLDDLIKDDLVNDETIVALFDANRPLTPTNQLQNLYQLALENECSCPARPVVNGVARIEEGRIVQVPEKSNFVEFVTPEFMRYSTLKESIEISNESLNCFVEYSLALGCKPTTIEACSLNTKLTFPEDKTYIEGLAIENRLVEPVKSNH
jgi:2-C-methyl-D-erythritol 4-phosphate cytidylyltransferase